MGSRLPYPSASSALAAAGVVGFWETDVRQGFSVLDRAAAALVAGDEDLAGKPLSLEAALVNIHPDDKDWVFARIRRVRRTGGPVSLEFRILDADGNVRWLLTRGSLAPDAQGAMCGCGVYIDTSDNHRAPFLPILVPPSTAPSAPPIQEDPLTEAVERSLEVRAALDRSGHGSLRLAVDILLLEIGRALAARRASRAGAMHLGSE